jgi:hypothetical protein
MTQENPWSGGSDRTRQEVREIFAQHARASARAEPSGEERRRRPLPNLFRLPGQLWRLLPPLGKVAVGLLLAALAALAAVLVPPALENAGENRVNQRRAAAANFGEIRRMLVEDQRPRRAALSLPAGASAAEIARRVAPRVAADARTRVRAGTLDGPIGRTSCRPVRRTQEAGWLVLTCLAERFRETDAYRDRDIVSGYRFRARVELATGAVAWCKENPRPLHPATGEFVVVDLSRACTG